MLDTIIAATQCLLRSRGPWTFLLPALVLALGLAISLVAWQQSRETLTRQLEAELMLAVDEVSDRIEDHFEAKVQILLGVAAQFSASSQVTRQAFARYVQALRLPERHPGIQAVGHARLIAADEQVAHMAEMQGEGFADYAISPPGARAFYTAVVYIEPLTGSNLRALGYDSATEPVRWAAVTRARDTGEPVLSGKVILRQEEAADAQPGFILVPIGHWVLREACRQAVAWHNLGWTGLVVAVNLSAVQFRQGDLEQQVLDAVAVSGLDPQRLELELTESILLEQGDSVRQAVERWKACGIQLSIDDFGTGYSSLAYLKRFKVDKLKIDRSFVADIQTNPEDHAIVQAVIQIARSFNLRTIAEGVEDALLAERLKVMGCDEAQGYLYAKPLPAPELECWLQARFEETTG